MSAAVNPNYMDSFEINKYRDHFQSYTNSFIRSDADPYVNKNYRLKQDHSLRVSENIKRIASDLKLSQERTNIAEAVALYHDIGRFEQFKKYITFSDRDSENHALLGIKVLKGLKILDQSRHKKLILSAIRFHNVKEIKERLKNTDPDIRFYSGMIRDADKLDIFAVLTSYYMNNGTDNPALDLDLPGQSHYTDSVLNDFFANRLIDVKNLKTALDFKVLQLSWVFDINFDFTIREIRNRGFIEKLLSVLPESEQTLLIKRHLELNFFDQT